MGTLAAAIGILALCCWLTSAVSALMMLRFRDGTKPLSWYALHGVAFFSATGFTDAARPWHRRFLFAGALFFLCCLAGVGVGLAQAAATGAPP
jgi:hypothetical protein